MVIARATKAKQRRNKSRSRTKRNIFRDSRRCHPSCFILSTKKTRRLTVTLISNLDPLRSVGVVERPFALDLFEEYNNSSNNSNNNNNTTQHKATKKKRPPVSSARSVSYQLTIFVTTSKNNKERKPWSSPSGPDHCLRHLMLPLILLLAKHLR